MNKRSAKKYAYQLSSILLEIALGEGKADVLAEDHTESDAVLVEHALREIAESLDQRYRRMLPLGTKGNRQLRGGLVDD